MFNKVNKENTDTLEEAKEDTGKFDTKGPSNLGDGRKKCFKVQEKPRVKWGFTKSKKGAYSYHLCTYK